MLLISYLLDEKFAIRALSCRAIIKEAELINEEKEDTKRSRVSSSATEYIAGDFRDCYPSWN